jgi:hypothetical protein
MPITFCLLHLTLLDIRRSVEQIPEKARKKRRRVERAGAEDRGGEYAKINEW